MDYTISYRNPVDHFVDIELTCHTNGKRYLDLLLPVWRPGRYELANYAKNIRGFHVKDVHGKELNFKKVSGNTWRVYTGNTKTIHAFYQYYAYQLDAGGSLLDDRQLYLNFINCLLYTKSEIQNPCRVMLKISHKYKIACGLSRTAPNQLHADNYFQLVDSPMIASARLKHWKFQQSGIQINLWFIGSHRLTKNKVVRAFKLFIKEQIKTMGNFPQRDFHFLFQTPEMKIYHGVEHANSTVIALGPGSELHKSRYHHFLGVSSHEFFHCWNVLKIRPKELIPYDFQNEVYFDTGFIIEGVTTYYGDLFLVRSGVFDLKQYFKELNVLFKRHFENEGRHHASLVDSSRDLWVDGYKQGAPGRKVSIYTKGALVALILDLAIRNCTEHQNSLDDVMRMLWEHFGKNDKGYSMNDFQDVCETVAGQQLKSLFQSFVLGTVPLETALASELQSVGCKLKKVPSRQLTKKKYGFRTSGDEDNITVEQIAEGSPAYWRLSTRDKIITINGKKPKKKLNSLIGNEDKLKLVVERLGRKIHITLASTQNRFFDQYRIEKQKHPPNSQKKNFRKWLGHSFDH